MISSQASTNKRLIYHASGGDSRLEEAFVSLQRLKADRDLVLPRLMFLHSLDTRDLG